MPWHMVLREEHFLGWSCDRAPVADVSLQGAQRAVWETVGVVILQLAQHRDGHQLGCTLQQRDDFALPYLHKRIDTRAPVTSCILRRQRNRAIDAPCATLTDASSGRSQNL